MIRAEDIDAKWRWREQTKGPEVENLPPAVIAICMFIFAFSF